MSRKRITLYIAALVCLLAVNSCKKSTKDKYVTYGEMEQEFQASLGAEDSLEVLSRANALMEGLKKGEVEESLSKLHMVKDGKLVQLAGDDLTALVQRFKALPVVDYHLEYFAFSLAELNDLKYDVEIGERNTSGKAPTMGFMLNPMKVNGKWYLCLKGKNQSSKEMLHPIAPNTIVKKK